METTPYYDKIHNSLLSNLILACNERNKEKIQELLLRLSNECGGMYDLTSEEEEAIKILK